MTSLIVPATLQPAPSSLDSRVATEQDRAGVYADVVSRGGGSRAVGERDI